jgi:hypothetical protein
MTTNKDLQDQLAEANAHLQQLHSDDVRLNGISDAIRQTLASIEQQGQTLLGLQVYANEALTQLVKQTDTVICILDTVAKQTCALLNEAHTQTGLQTSVKDSAATLVELYKTVHPAAALEQSRLQALRDQMAECCPPEAPAPFCNYDPCTSPSPLPSQPPPPQPPR